MKNTLLALSAGIMLMLGIKIKASAVIAFIAFCIYFAFHLKPRHCIHIITCIVAGALAVSVIWNTYVYPYARIDAELKDANEFPYTHWIMMGLTGMGNYCRDEVIYTWERPTYSEKKSANISLIKSRVHELGPVGVLKQFHRKATLFGWNYGTCYAERYLGDFGDKPVRKNMLHEFVLTDGLYHDIVYVLTQSFWLVCMIFTMIGFIFDLRKKDYPLFCIRLMVVGCMAFFMLWETHPRYVLHYSILLVMSGAITLDFFWKKVDVISSRFKNTSQKLSSIRGISL